MHRFKKQGNLILFALLIMLFNSLQTTIAEPVLNENPNDYVPLCPYSRTDLLLGTQYTPGDFNGDGKTDVIITTASGSYWYISTGVGNNYVPYQPYYRTDLPLGKVQYVPGDFNGDGKTDLVITTASGSYWYLSTGEGNEYKPYQPYYRTDLTFGKVQYVPGDFNGDGKTDLVITTASGSYWYLSTGKDFEYIPICPYSRTDLTLGNVAYTVGNFGGDRSDDLIISTASGSYWYITTGGLNEYIPYCPYSRSDLPIEKTQYCPGNFGGDIRTDVIITTASGSYWYISTGAGQEYVPVCPYTRTDLPLGKTLYFPGNYSGNLKTDVIIVTASGSYWYISTGEGNEYKPYQPYYRTDLPLNSVWYYSGNYGGEDHTDTIITTNSGSYWYITTLGAN